MKKIAKRGIILTLTLALVLVVFDSFAVIGFAKGEEAIDKKTTTPVSIDNQTNIVAIKFDIDGYKVSVTNQASHKISALAFTIQADGVETNILSGRKINGFETYSFNLTDKLSQDFLNESQEITVVVQKYKTPGEILAVIGIGILFIAFITIAGHLYFAWFWWKPPVKKVAFFIPIQ